ncbi:MAG: MATE family efflux transporter [Clostridia bacterium]|nr:MATE family efflux transporter [Clostridia bacterium]MBO5913179.1 MATE family efflux transporter [Clostridia bacterium]
MIKKYFGDKAFYKYVLSIAVPIMLQNGITNFVNMLDNIMVGRVGTEAMTGVSVSNQLIFVFNLCLFGAVSGVGIFGAQYYGKGDNEGLKNSLRFKIILCSAITVIGIGVFLILGNGLITSFLKGEANTVDPEISFKNAKNYLLIMLIGLIPFALTQSYSSTLRETGETVLPMKAGIIAVLVNLTFNYILIFGIKPLSIPALGAAGAAVATVLSRFVEAAIVIIWTHTHTAKNPYALGLFKNFNMPLSLAFDMFKKALPLTLNETLWASGVAILNQSYSTRGVDVVAANNINQTFWNLFAVIFLAMGNVIGIIIGNMLGAGRMKEVMDTDRKLIVFSLLISIAMCILYASLSPVIPLLYNTSNEVRHIASGLIVIGALMMPFDSLAHSSYFTLRSGGKSMITFVFDCGFMWFVSVPLAFCLSRFTDIGIVGLYAAVQSVYLLKGFIGIYLVSKGSWIKNIVGSN